jgi:hypothetical protein
MKNAGIITTPSSKSKSPCERRRHDSATSTALPKPIAQESWMPIISTTQNSEPKAVRGFGYDSISTLTRSTTDTTSFHNQISTRTYKDESKSAIESSSEDDVDESAIEEGDSDWEDDDNEEESAMASPKEDSMFRRVEFELNLRWHRSLLTTALHEGDRARALQNEVSRSTSAIRRSRTTTPNGPSIGKYPQEDGLMIRPSKQKPKPVIATTSNVHPPAMSPRTTRQLMLTQELTSSLRQNLLWERQQKNTTTNAVAKRQQSAISLPALRRAATTGHLPGMSADTQYATDSTTPFMDDTRFNSLNQDAYSAGLDPYHSQGW